MRYANNPANIRWSSKNAWKGLKGNNNGFCEFYDITYGLRALCLLLKRYIRSYGLNDVESIISRFAPPSENNTCNYIYYVREFLRARSCNLSDIKFGTKSFCVLVCAICWYETNFPLTRERVENIINMFKLDK